MLLHLLLHWTGGDNGSGPVYLEWSGFVGDVTIIGSLLYGSWKIYQHTRCHIDGCNKRGKYPFQHYRLCKNHHPAVPIKLTHRHIAKLHKASKEVYER